MKLYQHYLKIEARHPWMQDIRALTKIEVAGTIILLVGMVFLLALTLHTRSISYRTQRLLEQQQTTLALMNSNVETTSALRSLLRELDKKTERLAGQVDAIAKVLGSERVEVRKIIDENKP